MRVSCTQHGVSTAPECPPTRHMKALAETCLENCQAKLVCDDRRGEIIGHLVRGKPVLVPYDSDGNFEPCLKSGHTAHWAVLHGICLVVKSSCLLAAPLESLLEPDSECTRMFRIKDGVPEVRLTEVAQLALSADTAAVFVCGSQGKSRHVGLWDLDVLLDSNRNLAYIGPRHDASVFVVPDGGVAKGLSSQVLLLA